MRRHARPLIGIPLLALSTWALSACAQQRVVRWDPMLGNLPGAQSGMPVTNDTRFNFPSPTAAPEGGIRQEDESGDITLYARSARHLMAHIYTTLLNNERDLFTEQVLSSITRNEFLARGKDPGEAFDMLKATENDVLALFDAMPSGEHTPGVLFQKLGQIDGKNLYRLGVTGLAARDLRYHYLDAIMEGGNWRLRWFGP